MRSLKSDSFIYEHRKIILGLAAVLVPVFLSLLLPYVLF